MSTFGTADSDFKRRETRRRRMINETEKFVSEHLRKNHFRQHRGSEVTDRRTDPRIARSQDRRQKRTKNTPQYSASVGVLVDVERNELGQLDAELLVPLVCQLSRLVAMPWKGDVLLDFSGVSSVTQQFMQVHEWFRRKLMKQQRAVVLYIDGNCVGNPGRDEFERLLRIDGSIE